MATLNPKLCCGHFFSLNTSFFILKQHILKLRQIEFGLEDIAFLYTIPLLEFNVTTEKAEKYLKIFFLQ